MNTMQTLKSLGTTLYNLTKIILVFGCVLAVPVALVALLFTLPVWLLVLLVVFRP